jgi:ribokinase
MFDVISIGAATVDIFVKSNQFKVDGQTMSLDYSSKNEIEQSLITSGGGATNSSVSFSRLGLKSACLSLISTDPLSEYITADLKTNQVDSSLLISEKSNSTDFSVILVSTDGGRTIFTARGDSRLENKHFHWSKLKSKWLYITSLEGNLDLLEKIIGYAKENDIKICLNPGNRELSQPKILKPLLKHLDFLLLNKTEAQTLVDRPYSDPHFWTHLKSFGSSIIAVTKGREGAHVLSPSGDYFCPIINTRPVDETGAGDAFGSTFVSALIHSMSVDQALHWGIKNSASVVSYLGAKPGLLTLKQIS